MANKEEMARVISLAKADADNTLTLVRKSLSEKNLDEYSRGMATLAEKVKQLNECICRAKYADFLETEHPIITAVTEFYIETVKIKEDRDKNDGSIAGVNFEAKKSRIDLEKFCEFGDLSTDWARDCSKLLALLTLRETDVYAIKPNELAKKSFYFISQARAKKDGETPDSNTQIVRMLQKIIDEAIFVDDGTGKNVYKCTNHDLAFTQDAVTKIDTKEKCTIAMLNDRQFKTVMMSVFAHCLGETYKVKAAKAKKEA